MYAVSEITNYLCLAFSFRCAWTCAADIHFNSGFSSSSQAGPSSAFWRQEKRNSTSNVVKVHQTLLCCQLLKTNPYCNDTTDKPPIQDTALSIYHTVKFPVSNLKFQVLEDTCLQEIVTYERFKLWYFVLGWGYTVGGGGIKPKYKHLSSLPPCLLALNPHT